MVEKLNRNVASVAFDGLVDAACSNHSCGVTIAAGQGMLFRGSILAVGEDEKCVLLGTVEGAKARYILQKDVDATDANSDAVAIAYDEGRFVKQHTIVKSGYTLTPADIDELRTHNIGLVDEI